MNVALRMKREGDFQYQFEITEKKFYMAMCQSARPDRMTRL